LIIPVILCGGAGARLWPASRDDTPKPFLPLVGGRSTFAMTLERIADEAYFAPPVIVAAAVHRHLVEAARAAAGVTNVTLLLEPEPRDTAAAVGAAAALVADAAPDATILLLPADQVIRDVALFREAVVASEASAINGRIVIFGTRPDHPATGFGYIKPGRALMGTTVRSVEAFVEKPDALRASDFVAQGYLWNGGIFMMRAATALSELRAHAPDIARGVREAVARSTATGNVVTLPGDIFHMIPKLSFDHAVMEKTDRAAVAEARFEWSDVGTWASVWQASEKDSAGNAITGDAVVVDAKNVFVSTDRPTIGVVGLDDAVVVAEDGAVLVTTRARSSSVKSLVTALRTRPEKLFGDFIRHHRPWGHYQSLDQGAKHQVKRIVVNPGARLSLQKHFHRSEHWTVVAGVAEITVGMTMESLEVKTVRENESVYIPLGAIHRMANRGATPMTLIEVQVGDYLGEDDIVRLEDDYGRKD
jgi:mannose-1-phosphate guanylyltransferase/mannose-6-phosphate isomerase